MVVGAAGGHPQVVTESEPWAAPLWLLTWSMAVGACAYALTAIDVVGRRPVLIGSTTEVTARSAVDAP